MAKRVFTGWRVVEPGKCFHCGSDSDYGVDGRGTVMCSCQVDEDEDEYGPLDFDFSEYVA